MEGLRVASEFKLFPNDKNSPVIGPPEGMALAVVKFTVAPQKAASVLKASQFRVKDVTGAEHGCAFKSIYNMCDGKTNQTCEFPFNVPKAIAVTRLLVGDLELSLEGLAK